MGDHLLKVNLSLPFPQTLIQLFRIAFLALLMAVRVSVPLVPALVSFTQQLPNLSEADMIERVGWSSAARQSHSCVKQDSCERNGVIS